MKSFDAMGVLIGAFPLEGMIADDRGHMVHLFSGDFDFAATELDSGVVRLSAQLAGLSVHDAALARRLLEANLVGVETGAGAMAPDPVGSGDYALVDHVDVALLDADDFRLRVVDFMLCVEYWRAEGIGTLQAELRREAKAAIRGEETVVLRG